MYHYARTDQWRSQRRLRGSTPSIKKGVHSYCLVTEQKQWLITKIVATKCRILRLKCTKFRFRLGLHPKPRWESSQRSPDPLVGFKGPTSDGKEESRREKESGGIKGKGARTPSIKNFWLRHWHRRTGRQNKNMTAETH